MTGTLIHHIYAFSNYFDISLRRQPWIGYGGSCNIWRTLDRSRSPELRRAVRPSTRGMWHGMTVLVLGCVEVFGISADIGYTGDN